MWTTQTHTHTVTCGPLVSSLHTDTANSRLSTPPNLNDPARHSAEPELCTDRHPVKAQLDTGPQQGKGSSPGLRSWVTDLSGVWPRADLSMSQASLTPLTPHSGHKSVLRTESACADHRDSWVLGVTQVPCTEGPCSEEGRGPVASRAQLPAAWGCHAWRGGGGESCRRGRVSSWGISQRCSHLHSQHRSSE